MAYKNENSVYADVVALCKAGLSYCGIEGFDVIRATQAVNLNEDQPVILIDRMSSDQYGWQMAKDESKNHQFKHIDEFWQDIKFQVLGLKRRAGVLQTSAVTTSEDAVRSIMTYLQSPAGIRACQSKGYGVLRIKENPEPYFVGDSDTYEISPSFNVTLPLKQSVENVAEAVSSVSGSVESV